MTPGARKKTNGGARTAPAHDKILEAARELFAARGFRDTTVRMIAQKAKVNGAAVNYYFTSKEGLYEAIFDNAFRDFARPLLADLVQGVVDDKTWIAAIGKWFDFMLSLFLLDTPARALFRRLVAQERSSPTEYCKRIYDDVFMPVVDVFRKLMRMALPDAPEPQFRAVFVTYLGMCSCFMHRDPPWDAVEICDAVPRETWIAMLRDEILAAIHARYHFRVNQCVAQ